MPLHGDADQEIAVFRHQAAHAISLGADDNGRRALEIGAVQVGGGSGGGAEDPDPLFFQVLQELEKERLDEKFLRVLKTNSNILYL